MNTFLSGNYKKKKKMWSKPYDWHETTLNKRPSDKQITLFIRYSPSGIERKNDILVRCVKI